MAAKVAQQRQQRRNRQDGEQQAKRNKYLEKTKYKKPKVYQLPPLSPTVYKNNVDKEIITCNNNFGAGVDVVSNFYSSFRA
ncbi:hypothetical protein OUZ56_029363 [Daphnia magna]|uniref:Uncharacterized protein n=1 Tax=Daphnia magna TaxID=35525 RepID=A0ABR0B6L9_9CRUS|nr:hypothetical protein OUZ56_029363 [Daphnia magna]